MPSFEIARDESGEMKRVYLEQKVVNSDPLVILQAELAEHVPFEKALLDNLHLTLFHYGKPRALYEEILAVNPHLTFEEFMEQFYGVLDHNRTLPKEELTVACESLDLFGTSDKPVIVARIRRSAELLTLRALAVSRFHQFLIGCGIEQIDTFMQQSPNLMYQLPERYNPHVSLGYPHAPLQLPEMDLSYVQVVLTPVKIANVEVRD